MQADSLQHVSSILSSVSALISGLSPAVAEIRSPAITTPPATSKHEVNTMGAEFADVHAALQWISHTAQNPIKNRWNETDRFAWSDLPELYRMIKPLMYEAGVFHSQTMQTTNGLPQIVTTFRHIPTGTTHAEHLDITATSIEKQLKQGSQNLDEHQRWGWTMTYCRRYALYAALGLQPDDGGDLDDKSRGKTRKTKPATTSRREWLPMPGAEGEAAERKALAMGAKPFTAEQYARAAEQERRFEPLTAEETNYLNSVINPLNGDLRELNDIYEKLQEALFDRVRSGSVSFYDEEDQRRALYRVWLDACREYEAMKAQPEETTVADIAVIDDLPADELERLKKRRDKIREDVASGKMMIDCEDADELDTLYYGYMNGDVPQPPFPEEQKLPAVDLTSEHGALMHAKTIVCREIAEGEGTNEEKAALIKKVLSRTDWKTSLEITEILATLTNPGAPASGIELQEDDLPY